MKIQQNNFVKVEKVPDLTKRVLMVQVHLEVEFPWIIKHDDQWFQRTGKLGTDVETNSIPAAEYKNDLDERFWYNIYGEIVKE